MDEILPAGPDTGRWMRSHQQAQAPVEEAEAPPPPPLEPTVTVEDPDEAEIDPSPPSDPTRGVLSPSLRDIPGILATTQDELDNWDQQVQKRNRKLLGEMLGMTKSAFQHFPRSTESFWDGGQ